VSSSTSPQQVRKASCGVASSVLGLPKPLRLVEDDTAALHSSRGNRRGLRRFSQILIDYKCGLR